MNKNFKLLLGGQLVSQMGDKFHMIALAFWVLNTTGSSAKMGTVLAASVIPVVIFGLFSGAIIDRYSRKWVIVVTDVIRGVILLIFAWLMATGQMNFHIILFLQVLLSINTAFFNPAVPAMIPQIVDKDQLGRANAIHQSVNSFATIGGAALGGIAVSTLGYSWIFVLNGISFLISAGFESMIKISGILKEKAKSHNKSKFPIVIKKKETTSNNRTYVITLEGIDDPEPKGSGEGKIKVRAKITDIECGEKNCNWYDYDCCKRK